MRYKSTQRRGILLLMILGLLAMFGMVAVAFVVLSNQALKSSKGQLRKDQTFHPPANDLNEAAMHLARGSVNPVSKIPGNSILEDMYGNQTSAGNIVSANSICGGQLIEITTNVPDTVLYRRIGAVITFTKPDSGAAYGLSSRIVSISTVTPTPTPLRIQIMAFPNGAVPPVGSTFIINGMPFSGTGKGYNPVTGRLDLHYARRTDLTPPIFQLTGDLSTAAYGTSYPVSLLPFLPISTYANATTNPPDMVHGLLNGMPYPRVNKDYTAADYQTMFLATPPIPTSNPYAPGTFVNRILPSMHRPALVKYWYQKLFDDYALSGINIAGGDPTPRWMAIFFPIVAYKNGIIISPTGTDPQWPVNPTPEQIVAYILEMKRNIIGRPLNDDHPNFNGSNPTALLSYVYNDTTTGMYYPLSWECGDIFTGTHPTGIVFNQSNQPHWDVDTDGDGLPDAIWMDIGLPIRSTSDGRKYKPLVAYYCLDLDGRLNLNAHGTLAQANVALYSARVNSGTTYRFAGSMAGLTQQTPLLRGQGFGPADINLSVLLYPLLPPLEFQRLLGGNGNFEGRYGSIDTVPGIAVPGTYSGNFLGGNKFFNLPDNYSATGVLTVGYGNPVDLKGTMAIGLDPSGQPLYPEPVVTLGQTMLLSDPGVPLSQTTNPYVGEILTNPYAMNLSPNALRGIVGSSAGQNDNPFSAAELERILRLYDRDSSSLPSRLLELAPSLAQSRHLITTESHDVPSQPPPKIPNSWLAGGFAPQADLLNPDPTIVTPDQKDLIRVWYPPRSIGDLLTAKYYHAARQGGSDVSTSLNMANAAVAANAPKLFPRELLSGLKMNLNRSLENWEGHVFQLIANPTAGPQNVLFNYNSDGQSPLFYPTVSYMNYTLPDSTVVNGQPISGDIIPLSQQAKQLHARHLYVLMMLLRETGNVQFFTEGLNPVEQRKLTARRIAQWAINAVDFMTPDSAMTPFEYDEDPFTVNGWRVDGRIGTPAYPSPDDNDPTLAPYRGLVWGCKAPDLIMTENVNFHDKRLADTNMDASNFMRQDSDNDTPVAHPRDTSLDQPAIPQGSTFIELKCVRNDTNQQAPTDLYVNNGGRWFLDLARMAPAWNSGNWPAIYANRIDAAGVPAHLQQAYPVWRIVISENHIDQPNNNVYARLNNTTHPYYRPDTFTPQTEQIHTPQTAPLPASLLPTSPQPVVTIDRIIWFTPISPRTIADYPTDYHADAERVYYYRQGVNQLGGGEYLIIGPRATTHIGSLMVRVPRAVSAGDSWGMPSPQTFNLFPSGFVNYQGNNMYPETLASPNPQIKTPNAMVVATNVPQTVWPNRTNTAPDGIGLSISEPIPGLGNYYPEPTDIDPVSNRYEWYGDPQDPGTRTFLPDPEDNVAGRPLHNHMASGTMGTATAAPFFGGGYKTFLLQRLANPSEPFEPTTNPYITVDWMPADLTVFNGMDYMSRADWDAIVASNHFDPATPWDPTDPTLDNNTVRHFASRQRGDTTAILNNIWAQTSTNSYLPPQSAVGTTARDTNDVVFPCNLNHTLGYLNLAYWDRTALTTRLATASPPVTNWYDWNGESGVIPPYRDITNPATPNTDPSTQPWITRYTPDPSGGTPPIRYFGEPIAPFPWFTWNNRPYNSITELLLVPASDPGRMLSPLENSITPAVNPYFAANPNDMPFPSRLNFFSSLSGAGPAPSLHRIFDYLQVPSPFVDAETQGNPLTITTGLSPNHQFYPPFNLISNYRETGRINLNTIYPNPEPNPPYLSNVFNGLMNSFPGNWGQFVQSRRGYGNTAEVLETDPTVPTEFARPFRSSSGYDLTTPTLNSLGIDTRVLAYDRDISSTLLRSTPDGADPRQTTQTTPLFDYNKPGNPIQDTSRNPFFKYLGMERLANLTTTRSNVFAVWITVGYFEVTPAMPKTWMTNMPGMTPAQLQQLMQQIYPDGYELGQELGSDTGEIVRHRGFYIIDRSIPVGFQRGQDLNVEKAILLKRFIE